MNRKQLKAIFAILLLIFLTSCATIPSSKVEPTVISYDIDASISKVFVVAKEVISSYKNYQIVEEDETQGKIIVTSRHNPIAKGAQVVGTLLSGCRTTEEYDFRLIPVGKRSQLFISILILVHRPAFIESLPVTDKPAYQDMLRIAQGIKGKAEE